MTTLTTTQTDDAIRFAINDQVVGQYILNDPFKPFFHPLRTLRGHQLTVASPIDHRHHKGLMYALRCPDLNFWEEMPESEQCGVQEIISTTMLDADVNGFEQELLWRHRNGSMETYREQRRITCQVDPAAGAIRYDWQTTRTSLRDHRLMKSEFSKVDQQGRLINYHGLGVRLPWAWSHPNSQRCSYHGCTVDGKPATTEEAHGGAWRDIGFWGQIDGQWEPDTASISIGCAHGFTAFVLDSPFAYLAVGPSNLIEIDVAKGEVQHESYAITIRDER